MKLEEFIKEGIKKHVDNNNNWSLLTKEYLKRCVDETKNLKELAEVVSVCNAIQNIIF